MPSWTGLWLELRILEAGTRLLQQPKEDSVEIPVLVEPVPGKGYRARGGEPFALTAEGSTPGDALRLLEELIRKRMEGGASVVPLEIPSGQAWVRGAGMFKDDPLFDDWQAAIATHRDGDRVSSER